MSEGRRRRRSWCGPRPPFRPFRRGLLRLREGTLLMIYCVSVLPNHSGSVRCLAVPTGNTRAAAEPPPPSPRRRPALPHPPPLPSILSESECPTCSESRFYIIRVHHPSRLVLETCLAPKRALMHIALNTLLASNRTPSSAPFPASISGPDLPGLCPAPSGSRDWAPGPCHWTRIMTRI